MHGNILGGIVFLKDMRYVIIVSVLQIHSE